MNSPIKSSAQIRRVAACAALMAATATVSALDRAEVDRALTAAAGYRTGDTRQPLIAAEQVVRESKSRPQLSRYLEDQIARWLAGDAPLEFKQFLCRQLWIIGTDRSVPVVARLLVDERTADIACYALANHRSSKADNALREALPEAPGTAQIAIMNLIGERRDARSVDALGRLARSADRALSLAALDALGKIGTEPAAQALAHIRATCAEPARAAATFAYLQCAQQLAAEGKRSAARRIFNELAGGKESRLIQHAAFLGLVDLGGAEALKLVLSELHCRDAVMRAAAIDRVRILNARGATKRIVAELPKLPADRQALLIAALADRGDAAARPAITSAITSITPDVKTAALRALGRIGDAASVSVLAGAAARGSDEHKRAAFDSLQLLRGSRVNKTIIDKARESDAALRAGLIGVLRERNAVEAVPFLLKEASGPDEQARRASFRALGRLASEKELPSMIKLLATVPHENDYDEAESAVTAVAKKRSDESRRADAVLTALSAARPMPLRCSLIRVLGRIGNEPALAAVSAAFEDADAAVREAAVRALADWPTPAALPALLRIARDSSGETHRVLTLRGIVRLLGLPSERPMAGTVSMFERALELARSPGDKKLVLGGLAGVKDAAALKLVLQHLGNRDVQAEAASAAIRIAGEIAAGQPDDARLAMNQVLGAVLDPSLRKQAEEVLNKLK